MPQVPLFFIRIATVAAANVGCAFGGGSVPASPDVGPVAVRVENRSWSDATIYLVSNGLVQRIGIATAVATTTLWVPAQLLGQSSDVRLVTAPIGSNRSDATEPLLIRPGQLVELTLDNNLGLTGWGVW
jgi:hypothetical protein